MTKRISDEVCFEFRISNSAERQKVCAGMPLKGSGVAVGKRLRLVATPAKPSLVSSFYAKKTKQISGNPHAIREISEESATNKKNKAC